MGEPKLIEQMAVTYATEIERLTALVDEQNSQLAILRGVNTRLRAALFQQLEAHNYKEVLEIARKALANEQDK